MPSTDLAVDPLAWEQIGCAALHGDHESFGWVCAVRPWELHVMRGGCGWRLGIWDDNDRAARELVLWYETESDAFFSAALLIMGLLGDVAWMEQDESGKRPSEAVDAALGLQGSESVSEVATEAGAELRVETGADPETDQQGTGSDSERAVDQDGDAESLVPSGLAST